MNYMEMIEYIIFLAYFVNFLDTLDFRKAFQLGCIRGDEWFGLEISDFTVDL